VGTKTAKLYQNDTVKGFGETLGRDERGMKGGWGEDEEKKCAKNYFCNTRYLTSNSHRLSWFLRGLESPQGYD